MRTKDSPTPLHAVRRADLRENRIWDLAADEAILVVAAAVASVKCMTQLVRSAVPKHRCHSYRTAAGLCTAPTASASSARIAGNRR